VKKMSTYPSSSSSWSSLVVLWKQNDELGYPCHTVRHTACCDSSISGFNSERKRQKSVRQQRQTRRREREREREERRTGVESGQLGGGLAGTAHIETPFCHLVSHVFLEKILTGVSESGQVSRAPIETSFLSSRFSSVF
jgi:hypothetical protein